MKKKIIILIMIFLSSFAVQAKFEQGFIDTVYSFTPGTAQTHGQGEQYYPANIFGAPFAGATSSSPASAEADILSLGRDGEIIVGFKDYYIVDGEGADFTIFENVMINQGTQKAYAEPAKIAVSQNGIDFIEFPFDSISLEGCAGKTPTIGSANPFDPTRSGGDAFDLATIGLDYVKYIKITDISRVVTHDTKHPYYNPLGLVLGFDLDAVAGIHLNSEPTGVNEPKTSNDIIKTDSENIYYYGIHGKIAVYNLRGELIINREVNQNDVISLQNIPRGVYFIKAGETSLIMINC